MVVVAPTTANPELLWSRTISPPEGAGEESDTVPMETFPPGTELRLSVSPISLGGAIVSVAPCRLVSRTATMDAAISSGTGSVLIGKVAMVLPAATLIDAGKVADDVLLDSEMLTPPVGAGPVSVRVPVDAAPPATKGGDSDSDSTTAGLIVSVAVSLKDWALAFSIAVVMAAVP